MGLGFVNPPPTATGGVERRRRESVRGGKNRDNGKELGQNEIGRP